ncbi:hypothetical protein HYQ46_001995 [Verticillium longisporum]|nr:hypothetical protein HYQ46_001995 [Verticillium longisporum]
MKAASRRTTSPVRATASKRAASLSTLARSTGSRAVTARAEKKGLSALRRRWCRSWATVEKEDPGAPARFSLCISRIFHMKVPLRTTSQ